MLSLRILSLFDQPCVTVPNSDDSSGDPEVKDSVFTTCLRAEVEEASLNNYRLLIDIPHHNLLLKKPVPQSVYLTLRKL